MTAPSSKQAEAYINPMAEPEPSHETGLNTHFGNTMAPKAPSATASPRTSMGSNNPFRESSGNSSPKYSPQAKPGASARVTERPVSREGFPKYREEAFSGQPHRRSGSGSGSQGRAPPAYEEGASSAGRRRGSSLRERYPGDHSHQPLDVIRRDSRKAARSPHLHKKHIPGADVIDRLDPALGGVAYHHEGPYDAASLARNTSRKSERNPIDALKTSNAEALRATPSENVKDAVERHKPLDGTAVVPPGETDRFGRRYDYEEGADVMREPGSGDAGYKRWPGQEYDSEDLKGQSEPSFSLDRALRAHKISDDGEIEMEDRTNGKMDSKKIDRDYHNAERRGTLDTRDPVDIAGDDGKYVDLEMKHMRDNYKSSSSETHRSGSVKEGLKRRIGSLRKKKEEGFDLL